MLISYQLISRNLYCRPMQFNFQTALFFRRVLKFILFSDKFSTELEKTSIHFIQCLQFYISFSEKFDCRSVYNLCIPFIQYVSSFTFHFQTNISQIYIQVIHFINNVSKYIFHFQTTLLQTSIEELFSLSSEPLPLQYNDQHDLPQVHGLNILNSLFGDSSLSYALMPYTSQAVVLVVTSFESPAWSIRNAATMLFSK